MNKEEQLRNALTNLVMKLHKTGCWKELPISLKNQVSRALDDRIEFEKPDRKQLTIYQQ